MVFCRESSVSISTLEINLPNGQKKFIEIDPGEAYGRGNQTSTNLCIAAIEKIFKMTKVDNVLDVGCGTGVIAICAAMFGAKTAVATDVDPVAVEGTKINVKKNESSDQIQIVYDPLKGVNDRFDPVIANLGTSRILDMSEGLKSKMKKDALLLVSGIWSTAQKQTVIDQFKKLGLNLEEEFSQGGWFAFMFKLM